MKNILLKEYPQLHLHEHEKLLSIRNSDDIRDASINEDIIELKNHIEWVDRLKDDKTKHYFAVIYNNNVIGGVSVFDIDSKVKWGVFFTSDAPLIVRSIVPIYFIDFIFQTMKVKEIFAEVKIKNTNALSYNKNLGFKEIQSGELVTMSLDKECFEDAKNGIILKRIVKKINLYKFDLKIENKSLVKKNPNFQNFKTIPSTRQKSEGATGSFKGF